jgi:hypothetical protein
MSRSLRDYRRCVVLSVCGLCCWLAAISFASAAEIRTWTDSTGKFQVRAKFLSLTAGKVTLELDTGGQVEIPLDKLSAADQAYVKTLPTDNPFQPKSTSPFAPTPPAAAPSGGAARGVVDDSGNFESRLIRPNVAAAPALSLFNSGEGWQVDPALLTPETVDDHAGKPIRLPPKTAFHEKGVGVVFNAAMSHAVVGYNQSFPKDQTHTRLVLVELKTGKVLANRTTGGQLAPVALSNDARTVVMRRDEFGFGNADRLEVWTLSEQAIHKAEAWLPFNDEQGSDRDVLLAEFAADGRLITASAGGKVVAWDLSPLTPVWTCVSGKGCRPALSPNRKFLLLADKDQIALLDLERQRVAAAMPAPPGAFPKFSFHRSGARFAVMTQDKCLVWETATGRQFREIESSLVPGWGTPSPPIFANDEQLLISGKYLIDLPSLIPLWQYDGADVAVQAADAVWFVVSDGERNPGVMFGAKLPQPGVQDALEKALADPNFFIVKPGTAIKLNLERLPDADKREEVRQALTRQLQEKELRVDPNAEVELIAYFDPPQQKVVVYHGFGGTEGVNFNETVAHLELKWQGQNLWQAAAGNQPFVIQRERDEPLQEAIRRYEKPPYGFLTGVTLPRMLVRPGQGGNSRLLGSSRVTTTGIR